MRNLVGVLAMAAALVAVGVSLWRDYGMLVTLKRAFISYFAFYVIGTLVVFVFKTGVEEEWIALARRRQAALELKRKEQQRIHEAALQEAFEKRQAAEDAAFETETVET